MAIALLLPLAQPGNVEPSALQRLTGAISAAAIGEGAGSIVPAA
jgi:hypothetical protein